MHESNANNFHTTINSDQNSRNKKTDLSYNLSVVSITDKGNKHRSGDAKKNKDKTHSKPKNIFERILSYKSYSNKSKCQKEFLTAKAIAQSTIDIFAQIPQTKENNHLNFKPVTTSISTGNLMPTDSPNVSQINSKKLINSAKNETEFNFMSKTPTESLIINDSSQNSFQYSNIPIISQESASARNSPLTTQYSTTDDDTHLTLPNNDRSRKSSDNDSAVDLKFTDDSSDQDRTNTSETGSSRCPSTSLFVAEDCISAVDINTKNLYVPSISVKVKRTDSCSSWRKIRSALIWTPFIQQCARHKYPWIQIAGHQGNFKPGEQGTILKKYTGRESICLQMMNEDNLVNFVPQFKCDIDYEGEKYICMQDLLATFYQPSLIDIKMGTRTYLEEELMKAQHCPKPRQDMYEKMMEIDENEPTEEEHRMKATLKPRYMQWRESLSSTINLGFRIEGVKKVMGTQSRDYKRTKDRNDVKQILVDFIDSRPDIVELFIRRLTDLQKALEESIFFWDHEFIGSSLLFVHDKNCNANVWMIDFGKTIPLPPHCKIDHRSPWSVGNHEDGYLFGLEQLLNLLTEIHSEIKK